MCQQQVQRIVRSDNVLVVVLLAYLSGRVYDVPMMRGGRSGQAERKRVSSLAVL